MDPGDAMLMVKVVLVVIIVAIPVIRMIAVKAEATVVA